MKHFKYKALSIDGSVLKGEARASTHQEMLNYLHSDGYEPIYCREIKFRKYGKVSNHDLTPFFLNLEFMVKAGIGIQQALDEIAKEPGKLQDTAYGLAKSVSEGKPLSDAMESYPHVFDAVIVAKVRLGESTGDLALSFREINAYLEWVADIKGRLTKATRYPMIMGVVVLCAILVLIIFLVPEVANFTKSMGQEPPLPTLILLKLSELITENGMVIGGICAIIIAMGMAFYSLSQWFREFLLDILSGLPLISDCTKNLSLSRYLKTMASISNNGNNLVEAMTIAQLTCRNPRIAKKMQTVSQSVRDGLPLSKALAETKLFSPSIIQIFSIGEKTGNLDSTLNHLQDYYYEKVVKSFDRMAAYLEPALIIMAGIFLLISVYSIFIPLYNSMTEMELL